ncbi:MAG: hypothetical protein M3Z32_12635, partial [Acidobacteriota bacterium]|nr:hypothetical protein [Acidobacteriota bacterium]
MKTKSEKLFEQFLTANGVLFERIEEAALPRPDYLVSVGDRGLVFEVKEIAEDKNFGAVADPAHPHTK